MTGDNPVPFDTFEFLLFPKTKIPALWVALA
jgi:hypothetical protein